MPMANAYAPVFAPAYANANAYAHSYANVYANAYGYVELLTLSLGWRLGTKVFDPSPQLAVAELCLSYN